jgi:hypothetical protein
MRGLRNADDRNKSNEEKHMSKNHAAATDNNKPLVRHEEHLPSEMEEMMREDSGKGTSQAAEDNIVPLIYILQSNSPQVIKRNDAYIEGAEPGDIWLRHATHPIMKGSEGFLFVPCYWWKDWVEWIPRDKGGGFVGRLPVQHDDKGKLMPPPRAKEVRDPKSPNKLQFFTADGNEMVLTSNHAGFALAEGNGRPLPYVVPMKSTGLTVSRTWMASMNSKRSTDGRVLPSFAYKYRLITRHRKNKDGEWFVFDVSDAGPMTATDKQLYLDSRNLEMAFASGAKIAEEEISAGGEPNAGHDKNADF